MILLRQAIIHQIKTISNIKQEAPNVYKENMWRNLDLGVICHSAKQLIDQKTK